MPSSLTIGSEILSKVTSSGSSLRRLSVRSPSEGSGPSSDPVSIRREANSLRAQRVLSNAASFVNVATAAVAATGDLLARASRIAEQIQSTVDPHQRSALAAEAEATLAEIDRVQEEAEYRDESVLDQGQQLFAYTLESGETAFTISVSNVDTSRETLQVDDIDADSLLEDPESAIIALSEADLTVETTLASLDRSAHEIATLATEHGIGGALEAGSPKNGDEAVELADRIATAIEDSVISDPHQLEAARVSALLEADESEE